MDTAAELSRTLGPLRRAVLRATRTAANLPDLPEAQIELLRTLIAEGPLNPRTVAARLRIAPSTVSNLVKTMSATGLIERETAPNDLRTVHLTASAKARDLLDRYDRTSTATLAHSIGLLSANERNTLEAALPILGRLTEQLEVRN
ncbi:MarR family winged helix-turn-helix transcriptional regulator [Sciscionella sediminilitoris]|uniref:MarR family winged helix-turn-helix transcriptional regulator n=1 Tax=Sciscionella sediminilitoris TaxID=1445613 RepID=UPI0004DF357C|nr:MarR family transcriptional regulator [Sciscionella sp. SE31]